MKMIWTLAVIATSISSTPLGSSSHIIPYHHAVPRLLALPVGLFIYKRPSDYRLSSCRENVPMRRPQLRMRSVSDCFQWHTQLPSCFLWLKQLSCLGHFLLLLLVFFLLLPCLFPQPSTCPPPQKTYFQVCIIKITSEIPPVLMLYAHIYNLF